MTYIQYKHVRFQDKSLAMIDKANKIIDEYESKGYSLTLRQLYYRLVAANVIPNHQQSYKNLGSLISNARLAGLVSWRAIEDRTRNIRSNAHWSSPQNILDAVADQFYMDRWRGQNTYVEVWVEKDALVDVVGQACSKLDVPFFSCRGYTSQSEMWAAAQRIEARSHKDTVIIHLGDHDPSGIDMSRDIQDRLEMFNATPLEFKRIALNMNQIEQYDPPPNPAKLTDARAQGYIKRHGENSWELDALDPTILDELITTHVEPYIDKDHVRSIEQREEEAKRILGKVASKWEDIERIMGGY